ncbi:MAG: aminotransferase class I/II-fold pyridoxal phosphate-dependent enzyme, partial [Candidatus Omnitrophica bacterium]|nr:aminotransferase class I/II-fold pyridoxal phosphate-dependent enzyme [Candidatus Omnitrophota bacterium]
LKIRPADMFLFGNPNNPTANLIFNEKAGVEKIPAKMIVADEAFMDFLPQEKSLSLIKKAVKNKRIIVLRTFTKFYSMPGLRLGFMAAHKDIIARVRKIQVPWTCNMLAQIAAVDLLKQRDYMEKTRSLIGKERVWLAAELAKIKSFKIFPSCVNFLLVRIKDKRRNALGLKKLLFEKGIIIRNCSNFRGLDSSFFRVAVRLRQENRILIKMLQEIL